VNIAIVFYDEEKIMRPTILLALLLLALALPVALTAQEITATPETLVVGSSGLLADDGSIFYSVFLANNTTDDLSDLVISSALPDGATFGEMFWTPESAVFDGEAEGIVNWTLPELPADTLIGPFTYTVTFAEEDAMIPANVAASAIWSEGEVSAALFDSELLPSEASGSITVDVAGTDGIVQVENTGIFLLVPPNAYDQPVTFTFQRQPLTEDANLPPLAEGEDIWWCTSFTVSVEPADAVASESAYILLPTRRALTPGMEVISFIQPAGGDWTTLDGTESASVSGDGTHITFPLMDTPLLANFTLTAGVETKTRATASRSSGGKGSSWVDPEPEP
jgi:hypothetical protein